MFSSAPLSGTMFRGTQLTSRPMHVCARPQRVMVVAMAKPTKAAEFRGLTNEEIDKEVYICRRKLIDCRIAQKTRKGFLPSDFGWNERKIAQLLTIKREREIEQGVDRRESKRLAKKERVAKGFGQY